MVESVYHLAPCLFLGGGALCCQVAWLSFCLALWAVQVFSKGHDRAWPCFFKSLPMPPITCPLSPCHPVSYCGFHVGPLHPSSSLFTHTDTRRSLPCLMSISIALSKRLNPTYLEIINHPLYNRRPVNPGSPPPGLSRQATAVPSTFIPHSVIKFQWL